MASTASQISELQARAHDETGETDQFLRDYKDGGTEEDARHGATFLDLIEHKPNG